jgi:hypothetical protein
MLIYTRFRSARLPACEPSVIAAGAVVFRAVAAAAVFLTANEAVCVRGIVGFFAAAAADMLVPVVALRAPAPARADFMTVVPEDVLETVPVLFLRSPCLVAGRGPGERTVLGPVAARLVVVFFTCAGALTVDVVAPRGRVRALSYVLAPEPFSGLEGFSGDVGRDVYDWPAFSGETARKGEWG